MAIIQGLNASDMTDLMLNKKQNAVVSGTRTVGKEVTDRIRKDIIDACEIGCENLGVNAKGLDAVLEVYNEFRETTGKNYHNAFIDWLQGLPSIIAFGNYDDWKDEPKKALPFDHYGERMKLKEWLNQTDEESNKFSIEKTDKQYWWLIAREFFKLAEKAQKEKDKSVVSSKTVIASKTKEYKEKVHIAEVINKNNSYYGNPKIECLVEFEDGNNTWMETASNSSAGYAISEGYDYEITYHITRNDRFIITYAKALEKAKTPIKASKETKTTEQTKGILAGAGNFATQKDFPLYALENIDDEDAANETYREIKKDLDKLNNEISDTGYQVDLEDGRYEGVQLYVNGEFDYDGSVQEELEEKYDISSYNENRPNGFRSYQGSDKYKYYGYKDNNMNNEIEELSERPKFWDDYDKEYKEREQKAINFVNEKLAEFAKEHGFKKYNVAAKFSNGETWYSLDNTN